ncbi:unnamed protein product [Absidia cylindrospora]
MTYKQSSLRNQKAKLAADYNDLLKELSSREMASVGCYTIGDTIGEGTYGKVKLATHKLTGQHVAVKKINKQHASMIAREIHHHRQLEHPNIVRIYEIIMTESAIHIFSEYCPNGELFDLLASTGRFSESRAQLWFQQLTNALQLCHRQGIVHRDLKLENILLDSNDNCKICDFGFARFTDNKQLLETFCGSLAYSAPEVIMRQKYTGPETDIWSLGVILYTLLAGELPFDDDSEIVTQRKIVNVDYEMPGYFSAYAQDLIANLLIRDPTDRLTMDQIINHPWMQNSLAEYDTSATHINEHELDISSSSSNDDDDDDDDMDDDDCSSSTRYSSRSDLDSIFSNPRFKNDLMEEDEDDLMTEASFISNSDGGKSGELMQQHFRKNGYSDGSKFSPQVRFSLGMMRPEDKAKYTSRSPRFSAPTVSNRPTSTQSTTTTAFRSSLPLSLLSSRESIRPSSISSTSSFDINPMNPTEQHVANSLIAAGFDEYIVNSMRSNTCGTANTLWNMLMDKQRQTQQQHRDDSITVSSYSAQDNNTKMMNTNNRWSTSSPKHLSIDKNSTIPVDSSCQTVSSQLPPSTVSLVDRTTQTTPTNSLIIKPDLDKTTCEDTTNWTSSAPSSMIPRDQSYSSFNSKPSPRSISSVTSSSSVSTMGSEKSGWFTSVKSWFGGNGGKMESSIPQAPVRPSSLRQQHRLQQYQQQPVSYRDFDSRSPIGMENIQSELAPPIYRSGMNKYRRHLMQMEDKWIQQQSKENNTDMDVMLSPPAPTATMTPRPTADTLSIITTPKYVSSTAVPSHVTEMDICEKLYPTYHRPLPPLAPPAPTYTNNSKNSNNRQCYQNQCLPRQIKQQHQQQLSPPTSPPVIESVSATSNDKLYSQSTDTSSSSNNIIHPVSPLPTSAELIEPVATSSSPYPDSTVSKTSSLLSPSPKSNITPILPPTPPTTEEEKKMEKASTEEKENVAQTRLMAAPSASSPPLAPHSSKSSPALLTSNHSSKMMPSALSSRRFEFTPRSRLSVYGMNDRGARGSMTSKAIIEEEEEEE